MEPSPPAPSLSLRVLRYVLSATLLVSGISLGLRAIRSANQFESVNPESVIEPVVDPAELARRRHDVVGTFATGDKPGDRVIEISADGVVKFSEIRAKGTSTPDVDTYQIGRSNRNSCLKTKASGTIEMLDIDTLEYYRDRYRRTK